MWWSWDDEENNTWHKHSVRRKNVKKKKKKKESYLRYSYGGVPYVFHMCLSIIHAIIKYNPYRVEVHVPNQGTIQNL